MSGLKWLEVKHGSECLITNASTHLPSRCSVQLILQISGRRRATHGQVQSARDRLQKPEVRLADARHSRVILILWYSSVIMGRESSTLSQTQGQEDRASKFKP